MRTLKKEQAYRVSTIKHCDKCGVDTEPESKYNGFSSDIELRIGEDCGYDGFIGETYFLDLCEPCAKELFLEILPKLGYKLNEDRK